MRSTARTLLISIAAVVPVSGESAHVEHLDAALASGRYRGTHNSIAVLKNARGNYQMVIYAGGNPRQGVAVAADCELRAVLNGRSHRWRLTPFTSKAMSVSKYDLNDIHFSIKVLNVREFIVDTDYQEMLCGRGVVFSGYYRKTL